MERIEQDVQSTNPRMVVSPARSWVSARLFRLKVFDVGMIASQFSGRRDHGSIAYSALKPRMADGSCFLVWYIVLTFLVVQYTPT